MYELLLIEDEGSSPHYSTYVSLKKADQKKNIQLYSQISQ